MEKYHEMKCIYKAGLNTISMQVNQINTVGLIIDIQRSQKNTLKLNLFISLYTVLKLAYVNLIVIIICKCVNT